MKLCKRCQHSWGFNWNVSDETAVQMIDCTLNPIWQKVRSTHFCSQHEGSNKLPAQENLYGAEPAQHWKNTERQRDRAIAAERKLKAANAKIRELKAEAKRG